jgi:hypothetical protein
MQSEKKLDKEEVRIKACIENDLCRAVETVADYADFLPITDDDRLLSQVFFISTLKFAKSMNMETLVDVLTEIGIEDVDI